MSKSTDVLIVGAGLAGLNAAIKCQVAGLSVTVLEASDRSGGRVASDLIDGFICDRGFQLINSKYPALQELNVINELDFIVAPAVIEVAIDEKRHAIGDPRRAPLSAFDASTGSLLEKAQLLQFLLLGGGNKGSLGESLRNTGRVYDRVLRPFLQGVFLIDPDQVDVTYGHSIMKSFVTGVPGIPRLGVGELPKALAHRVTSIQYGVSVERIVGKRVYTNDGEYSADKIVVATDSVTANTLLELNQTPRMAGCITWYHAMEENPSGNGRLVIDGHNRGPVLNSVVISDISSSYAPIGSHLLSTTTALGVNENQVREHLSLLWASPTNRWQLVARYEIPQALPVQEVGRALSQKIMLNENHFVIGDHRTVPSQQGALFSGALAAQMIIDNQPSTN